MGFSLVGFSLSTQGPITKNQSALFGARRSFLDLIAELIDWEGINDSEMIIAPRYDDYQGKYQWKLNSNNILNFQLNGARDRSTVNENPRGNPWIKNIDHSYNTQGIVWDRFFGQHSSKTAIGYLTQDTLTIDGQQSETREVTKNIFVREKIHYQLNKSHAITLGGDLSTQQRGYYNDQRIGCNGELCRQITDINNRINFGATYLKDRWQLTDELSLDLGARLNGNDLVKRFYLDPRLGMKWQMTPKTALTTAWGRHNQMPNLNAEFGPWGKANLEHYRSDQSVVGVSHQLNKYWHWKTEVFYKKLWNLLQWDSDNNVNTNNGIGKAYGAEFFIQKKFSRQLSGWLSMTYSKTELTNSLTNFTAPTDFDQPIITTLILSKHFSKRWYFDLKWYFHSGRPYTPIIDGTPVLNDATGEIIRYSPVSGSYNSARLPNYHRLDVRVSKQLKYTHWDLNLFLAVINAYDRRNVYGYRYSFDKKSKKPRLEVPMFPSIGFKASFGSSDKSVGKILRI